MAGLKGRVQTTAQEEAFKVVAAYVAVTGARGKCGTMGVVTAIDGDTGRCTIITMDGSTVIAQLSGNRAVGVGSVVPLVGNVII